MLPRIFHADTVTARHTSHSRNLSAAADLAGTIPMMTRSPFAPLLAAVALVLTGIVSLACNSTPPNVGSACSPGQNGGCDPGLSCDTSIDGGYCTSSCATAGSTNGCPEESVCDSIAGGPLLCLRICTVQGDCRADLQCNGVTGSNLKACRPQ